MRWTIHLSIGLHVFMYNKSSRYIFKGLAFLYRFNNQKRLNFSQYSCYQDEIYWQAPIGAAISSFLERFIIFKFIAPPPSPLPPSRSSLHPQKLSQTYLNKSLWVSERVFKNFPDGTNVETWELWVWDILCIQPNMLLLYTLENKPTIFKLC